MKTSPNRNEKQKRDILAISLLVLVLIGLTLFCKAVNFSLIIPLLVVFMGLHLTLIKKGGMRMFLHLGLLLTLLVFGSHSFLEYTVRSHLYIPVACVAMLTMLLFKDLQLAFLMAFISSVMVGLILGNNFEVTLIFFVGSITGSYIVRDARTRGNLITAGAFVSLMQVVCLILLNPNTELIMTREFSTNFIWPLVFNGLIASLIVAAALKIFEITFGVLTNFSLLELSDFNQPLLKRMVLEAPGTYHHSLLVSNLSEAAADAIGADSLLTRVGAYYHDIGKMVKSEYFTENQIMTGNKHDQIEPSMSRLVIQNHVKEGIELAKKNKLNQKIIDFIPQHHGTSVMHYFYQKALEEAADGEIVNENDYRYPGPKPQTRETAITLLADSVEGATRALDDPNPQNIEETVRKIVNNKFIDGQLDECPLTLTEIDKIVSTFVRILTAMYHGRVKYPEANGNHTRKPAKENPPQSRPGPTDH